MVERGEPRTLLERIIRDGEYTIEEWRRRFDHTARDIGETATLSARQLQRWMAGEVEDARPSARRVAARLWGHPLATLLMPPPAGAAAAAEAPAAAPPADGTPDLAAAAARESSRHAAAAAGTVSRALVEQVQAEVWRLAEDYAATAPTLLLTQARQARDLAYAALDRTRRPAQTRELYLAAGQLCGLMAVAAFDLAGWDAAADQARAAQVYAEVVDHPGLLAWALGTQALISYWRGRPRQALRYAESGLARVPAGAAEARLLSIQARAWSQLGGDPRRTTDALVAADHALDAGPGDDLHDGIGGKFGWGPARNAACASTALLSIGDAAGSVARAREALQLISADPVAGLVRERTLVDKAAAELALGEPEAAEDTLAPVWQLPVPHRRHGVTDRLDHIARRLGAATWRRDRQVTHLRERIVAFNGEAAARSL
jgi:hypothetical protein